MRVASQISKWVATVLFLPSFEQPDSEENRH